MKNFSRKLSLQWRLTLITALLVTITCILMYFFISQSAVTGMDHLQNYIVQINKTDSSPITFNIDPTILFPDLSEQVTTTKQLFQIRSLITTAEARDRLAQVGLPANLLVEHELNPGYKRLPLRYLEKFDNLSLYSPSDPSAPHAELNSDQIEAFRFICNLSKDNSCDEVIKGNLKKEMFRYPSLATLIDWWDSIRLALRLTSVGRCVASANVRRLKPGLPEL